MPLSRRDLLHAAAIAPALSALAAARAERPIPRPADRQPGAYRLGVIGCGGRGTGAAVDFLTAAPEARLVAMADAFGPTGLSAAFGEALRPLVGSVHPAVLLLVLVDNYQIPLDQH